MSDLPSSTNIGDVLAVLRGMQIKNIISKFAIGGAFAAILHNEPISTIDLDIFFFLIRNSRGLTAIYDYAKANGFSFDHEFIHIHGWLVRFFEASYSPLWTEAINEARTKSIDGYKVPVIGREYLVAMWLLAGRAKDHEKIASFWDAGLIDTVKLKNILGRHDLLLKWEKKKKRFISEKGS